jgi:thioredoxin 1
MSLSVDRDTYEAEVLQHKGLVLVDFWGPQCRSCLALMPTVEKMTDDYANRVKVTKVNAAENRMLCAKLRVLGLPTFLLYKDGVELKRLVGESVRENEIRNAIADELA